MLEKWAASAWAAFHGLDFEQPDRIFVPEALELAIFGAISGIFTSDGSFAAMEAKNAPLFWFRYLRGQLSFTPEPESKVWVEVAKLAEGDAALRRACVRFRVAIAKQGRPVPHALVALPHGGTRGRSSSSARRNRALGAAVDGAMSAGGIGKTQAYRVALAVAKAAGVSEMISADAVKKIYQEQSGNN